MRKAFLENEYKRRIKIGENQRIEKYYDENYVCGDLVYFQDGMEKCWRGPVEVLKHVSNSEVHLDILKLREAIREYISVKSQGCKVTLTRMTRSKILIRMITSVLWNRG